MDLKNLFAVLVLYKKNLEEAVTLQSLAKVSHEPLTLLVFDNSPNKQYEKKQFIFDKFNVIYHHDATNPGLSKAYNLALEIAKERNFKWLLLLDQDTTFTNEYLQELVDLNPNKLTQNVVAIAPKVLSMGNSRMISPSKMTVGGICRPIKIDAGIAKKPLTAINSGSILNVDYMTRSGGFSQKFTLDMLDHSYYRKIFNDKKTVYVLNATIFQDLSVFGDFQKSVTIQRYQQMLQAEHQFNKEHPLFSFLVFKFRLMVRLIKQVRFSDKNYYKFTVKYIFKIR